MIHFGIAFSAKLPSVLYYLAWFSISLGKNPQPCKIISVT